MNKTRLIVVSHQLPFMITLEDQRTWRLAPRTGHAALYAGIDAVTAMADHQVVHVGWTGYCHDSKGTEIDLAALDKPLVEELMAILKSQQTEPVLLPVKAATGHYESYCKSGVHFRAFKYINNI